MKHFLPAFFILTALISCESNNNTNLGKIDSIVNNRLSADNAVKDLSGCYRMIVKKDTAILKLTVEEKEVSGSLQYNRYEKDDNDGTIRGAINDSLIIADYTFQSEGMTSVRQVVFRIREDSLFQGYGEERVVKDTAIFRDIKLVIYDTKHPFVKDCY